MEETAYNEVSNIYCLHTEILISFFKCVLSVLNFHFNVMMTTKLCSFEIPSLK